MLSAFQHPKPQRGSVIRTRSIPQAPTRLEAVPQRGLRRKDAVRYVGGSSAKFDERVRDGRMLKPFRIVGCVIWDLRRFDAAFDVLSEVVEPNAFPERTM